MNIDNSSMQNFVMEYYSSQLEQASQKQLVFSQDMRLVSRDDPRVFEIRALFERIFLDIQTAKKNLYVSTERRNAFYHSLARYLLREGMEKKETEGKINVLIAYFNGFLVSKPCTSETMKKIDTLLLFRGKQLAAEHRIFLSDVLRIYLGERLLARRTYSILLLIERYQELKARIKPFPLPVKESRHANLLHTISVIFSSAVSPWSTNPSEDSDLLHFFIKMQMRENDADLKEAAAQMLLWLRLMNLKKVYSEFKPISILHEMNVFADENKTLIANDLTNLAPLAARVGKWKHLTFDDSVSTAIQEVRECYLWQQETKKIDYNVYRTIWNALDRERDGDKQDYLAPDAFEALTENLTADLLEAPYLDKINKIQQGIAEGANAPLKTPSCFTKWLFVPLQKEEFEKIAPPFNYAKRVANWFEADYDPFVKEPAYKHIRSKKSQAAVRFEHQFAQMADHIAFRFGRRYARFCPKKKMHEFAIALPLIVESPLFEERQRFYNFTLAFEYPVAPDQPLNGLEINAKCYHRHLTLREQDDQLTELGSLMHYVEKYDSTVSYLANAVNLEDLYRKEAADGSYLARTLTEGRVAIIDPKYSSNGVPTLIHAMLLPSLILTDDVET